MVNHVLNHLSLEAHKVLLALTHLAVDDHVISNLALDIARGLGDLLVRQAALLHLAEDYEIISEDYENISEDYRIISEGYKQ